MTRLTGRKPTCRCFVITTVTLSADNKGILNNNFSNFVFFHWKLKVIKQKINVTFILTNLFSHSFLSIGHTETLYLYKSYNAFLYLLCCICNITMLSCIYCAVSALLQSLGFMMSSFILNPWPWPYHYHCDLGQLTLYRTHE